MIYHGDCIEVMKSLPENSIDTCITDPPYGLGFMGKKWDSSGVAFQVETWQAVFRVLKPGAILLAFGGTRTYHRLVCAIEDAGFEIRDTIAWVYGSGFPKSYDISKGIDKQAGAKREVVGKSRDKGYTPNGVTSGASIGGVQGGHNYQSVFNFTAPSTPEAQLWDGWGTALKPAHEPIVVAMKPIDGTFVNNALTWGVAGLWIDGGRVGCNLDDEDLSRGRKTTAGVGIWGNSKTSAHLEASQLGRFPANLIHDGSDEVLECFPQSNGSKPIERPDGFARFNGKEYANGQVYNAPAFTSTGYEDNGSASRFFYCAKASRKERNAGLEGMEERSKATTYGNGFNSETKLATKAQQEAGFVDRGKTTNHHPTVKPIELMRYLVRLTKTPTGGVVLDPFTGSGTTGIACVLEGRDFIGIEKEAEYIEIAEKRITHYELPLLQDVLSGV